MNQAPNDQQSLIQRRRLLKGALGASSVVTLGYGGAAAAASLNCVAKVWQDGGYPRQQFSISTEPPTDNGTRWAWSRVEVLNYRIRRSNSDDSSSTQEVKAFSIEGTEYLIIDGQPYPRSELPLGVGVEEQLAGTETGWVLAYFNESGVQVGTYPQFTQATDQEAPVSASCLNSINPNAGGSFGFGG